MGLIFFSTLIAAASARAIVSVRKKIKADKADKAKNGNGLPAKDKKPCKTDEK